MDKKNAAEHKSGIVISDEDMKNLSPMMRQYLLTKEEYGDCILFYRLGDFYEMFFDDALTASRELEITLTGKDCGLKERAPMCGIPYHSVMPYVSKLISKGYKVAVCEQVEDPKKAKGIVKRDVVRVITPGTLIEDELLDEKSNNYLAVVYVVQRRAALIFCDVSTGELFGAETDSLSGIINEAARYSPSEMITNSGGKPELNREITARLNIIPDFSHPDIFDTNGAAELVKEHLETDGGEPNDILTTAAAAMLRYLFLTQKSSVPYIKRLSIYSISDYMDIDASTRRNLELTETMREKKRDGSLVWALDKTRTSMGARHLKQWIEKPLVNVVKINGRLEAVGELKDDFDLRGSACEVLDASYDIFRIMSRASAGTVTPKDMLALKNTLNALPMLEDVISRAKSPIIHTMKISFAALKRLWLFLESAIKDDAPAIIRDGGMIKQGHSRQVDELRDIKENARAYLEAFAESERGRTGISKLKIGYNKVFGYYIDITRSQSENVPDDYIRRQTLANSERYTTEKLKEIEDEIMGASEKLLELELHLYHEAVDEVLGFSDELHALASSLSVLDCLCSFAEAAAKNNYSRPSVDNSGVIEITGGRHPVVELTAKDSIFVPNNAHLDTEKNRLIILTGPNMAGKSTYMRQTALITLMAQTGSFVPAEAAHIGIVDRIFTRVGASDDIASGQSTFMLEMTEVANILKTATNRSLIILDEIGRGTSTFDGLSIAWAVAEYVCDKKKLGAKTLFATHYHEMTELEGKMDGAKNYSISVKKKGDEITFLRKIVRGGSDRSYGIEVAALAGVPRPVITAAKRILKHLESTMPKRGEPIFEQLTLDIESDEFSSDEKNIDIDFYSRADYMPEGEPYPGAEHGTDAAPPAVREVTAEERTAMEIYEELKSLNLPEMSIIESAQKLLELAAKVQK